MTAALSPVQFEAPLVNPAPNGLVAATQWVDESGPLRWLPSGVEFRVFNYGGGTQFGVWSAAWNATESELKPADVKKGERPAFLDAFIAQTTYASDDCSLLKRSRDEIRVRAQQVHRVLEPIQTEKTLAARMLLDAGTPAAKTGIVAAIGAIEGLIADTGTVGVIHASAELAAPAAQANLIRYNNGRLVSPLGNTWVFGGGYVSALGAKLIATSPTYGWRGPVELRDAPSLQHNEFKAIAERSLVVGYEALIGAVNIT
ncbi:hypothetical protein [Mycobacteroides abscessus]|uniref:hypothetical protein n=1 Tax=Mycobacteroides abscessus TaxID=36809 RepID=UPI000241C489|nr:hypothetical protein [Mycobacteroides abscessus]EHM15844.1 hypothetical protein MBOL_42330 [Mycobacteroides abscessus subsp. bolletii BD]ORA22860.1 hypothetical protein BST18_23730 [Mycobacteroides abscessus subsp. bolletii]TPF68363.1 hypothetical protein XW60_05855 [Mycobacteroides abscessus subsp. bolletii]BBB42860.1 hypothetical protein MASB_34260 [Mycobacteroides abscessus subsp. bolletii BD]